MALAVAFNLWKRTFRNSADETSHRIGTELYKRRILLNRDWNFTVHVTGILDNLHKFDRIQWFAGVVHHLTGC
jgi:hypothetical protein